MKQFSEATRVHLTSSPKKYAFSIWLIIKFLHLCVTYFWVTRKVF